MRHHLRPLLLVLLACASRAAAAGEQSPEVCARLVGLLTSDFIYHVPNTALERVEVRQCDAGAGEALQLVAWERHAKAPSLVLDTKDFGVVQAVNKGTVYVIEAGGGPRDHVYVIIYDAGKPKLALQRVTRASAEILVGVAAVRVRIPNTWTGKTEVFSFPVK